MKQIGWLNPEYLRNPDYPKWLTPVSFTEIKGWVPMYVDDAVDTETDAAKIEKIFYEDDNK